MGKMGTWKVHPIKNEIILTLLRHKGEMIDADLLRALQNVYQDINRSVLNKILFSLEVEMVINVQKLKKNQNKVSLRDRAPIDENLKKFVH
ncbi:MAG: hypothetical protein GY870_12175 [archaeon]|nr:hypothetical protein [archaeon]